MLCRSYYSLGSDDIVAKGLPWAVGRWMMFEWKPTNKSHVYLNLAAPSITSVCTAITKPRSEEVSECECNRRFHIMAVGPFVVTRWPWMS